MPVAGLPLSTIPSPKPRVRRVPFSCSLNQQRADLCSTLVLVLREYVVCVPKRLAQCDFISLKLGENERVHKLQKGGKLAHTK